MRGCSKCIMLFCMHMPHASCRSFLECRQHLLQALACECFMRPSNNSGRARCRTWVLLTSCPRRTCPTTTPSPSHGLRPRYDACLAHRLSAGCARVSHLAISTCEVYAAPQQAKTPLWLLSGMSGFACQGERFVPHPEGCTARAC